jgi:hypothetical protein
MRGQPHGMTPVDINFVYLLIPIPPGSENNLFSIRRPAWIFIKFRGMGYLNLLQKYQYLHS